MTGAGSKDGTILVLTNTVNKTVNAAIVVSKVGKHTVVVN